MPTDKQIIEAHYAASDRGDLDGMLAPLAADIEWVEAAGFPLAGTYRGPDAVKTGVFIALGGLFEGFSLTIDRVIDGGDGAVVGIGTYRGTNRESGKSFEARVVHIWTVRDGQAVAFEQVADTALIVATLP